MEKSTSQQQQMIKALSLDINIHEGYVKYFKQKIAETSKKIQQTKLDVWEDGRVQNVGLVNLIHDLQVFTSKLEAESSIMVRAYRDLKRFKDIYGIKEAEE